MILLCGSALSVMGGLLSGNAPLRGRAGLEMVVRPFPWRLAARYWGLTDPRLAILLNAVVGGTAAYRQLAGDDSPRDRADFDDWVVRTVLSPASPLQREARYLLDEEPGIRDTGLYHWALAAVASGNATRGGIASYIGLAGDGRRPPPERAGGTAACCAGTRMCSAPGARTIRWLSR